MRTCCTYRSIQLIKACAPVLPDNSHVWRRLYVPRAVVPHGPQLRPIAPAGFFSAPLLSRLQIAFRGCARAALYQRAQWGLCRFVRALGKISACVGEPRVQTLLYEAHFLLRSRRIWGFYFFSFGITYASNCEMYLAYRIFLPRLSSTMAHLHVVLIDHKCGAGRHLIWRHPQSRLLTMLSFICIQICAAAAADDNI